MGKLHNQSKQKLKRQNLRNEPTKTELILWGHLRKSQINEHKFRRQFGIGVYIVDFCCPRKKLVIELDGDSHFSPAERSYDQKRSHFIKSNGFSIIRFTNLDVYHDLETVLEKITLRLDPL